MRELHDLVDDFVRRAKYGFDETYVKQELAFYGVTAADQQYIEDLLKKIGSVAYRNSEGPEPNVYKMFRINPIDGMLTMELLDESGGRRASRVGGR
jgi:hypothetical protein